jgi:hypothetical protein
VLRKSLADTTLAAVDAPLMRHVKQQGFADAQLASTLGSTAAAVRARRKGLGVLPCVKQIDTLAAEFPAQTNYLYMTYSATDSDPPVLSRDFKKTTMVPWRPPLLQ